MKKFKRSIALTLAMALLLACAPVTLASQPELRIANPYESVDWDTWALYKAQLHCHTNASDGYMTIKELVQNSYDLDYDIVAVTDHGTLNRGWDTAPQLVPLMRLIKYERTQMADIIPLTAEEYAAYLDGTALKSDGSARANGMLDIPLGIELNLATPKADCHLTGYWADYGQGCIGVYGDYETPAAGVRAAGGVTMLSHVGEYVYPEKDSENHVGQPIDDYYANKFARLFLDNVGSALGMGINSATDAHTRCDRILYDQILAKTIPNGVVPWAFSFSDAHSIAALGEAHTLHAMPVLTPDAFRTSMEDGTFFAVCKYSNGYELDGIAEMPAGYTADDSIAPPRVTRVTVDEDANTVTVEGEGFNRIVWVGDGEVLTRADVPDGSFTIDLDEYDAELFARFYVTGDGGILYAQPFVLNREGVTREPVEVPVTKDISTTLRKLVTVVDILFFKFNVFIQLFKLTALGYTDWALPDFSDISVFQ